MPQDRTRRAGKWTENAINPVGACSSLFKNMIQNRITHFCLPSFRCLAVIRHSFSYIFLAAHPSRSYVIMHAQQICVCACSPPRVTFYIPD